MAYSDAIKDIFLTIHGNIDSLFNYLDLDFLKEVTTNELIQSNDILSLLIKHSFIFGNLILSFYIQLSKIIYFYYPLIKSIPEFLIEFLKGNWINNFINLPISMNHSINSILNEDLFFKTQYTNTINLLKIPSYLDNKFYIGFLNSFFLSFPFFSSNQTICFYRFLFNGPVIGIISTLGWIFGQCLLLCCVLFGCKSIIIQWFSLEPLTYFLSIYLISTFIYKTLAAQTDKQGKRKKIKKRRKKVIKKKQVSKKKFWKTWKRKKTLKLEHIFAFHCLLSWTEGGYLLPYLTTLNFGLNTNIFDISITNSINDYIIIHGSYILGVGIGCLFYSFLYYEFFLKILMYFYYIPIDKEGNQITVNFRKLTKIFIKKLKITIFAFLMFLTMSSLSYYDIGYLLTSSFGFSPQDKLLSDILLNSNSNDPLLIGFGARKDYLLEADNDYMYTDILQINIDNKEYKNTLEFEDINYAAEYAWMSKIDKMSNLQKEVEIMKNKSLRPTEENIYHDSLIYPSKILKHRNQFDFNLSLIANRFINENYLNLNNQRNSFIQENIDTFFKSDFLPYNRYFLAEIERDVREMEIEEEIKEKYYINPLYKIILNLEADTFLSRNSSNILLEFEENDLYQKRIALSNYLESNFYYSKMNKFDNFRNFFFNSKSFINNYYNQQFKGTLRIVDQLFPVTIDDNFTNRSILKYDQPLFYKQNKNAIFHEELIDSQNVLTPNYKGFLINSASPLFIKWNDNLHQLTLTNNLFFVNPNYPNNLLYSSSKGADSLNLLNLQKLNNISRDSYSILQLPSLKEMILSNAFSGYSLDSMNLELNQYYQIYLNRVSKKQIPNFDGCNWNNIVNWYSFRYMDTSDSIKEARDDYDKKLEKKQTRRSPIWEEFKEE